MCHERRVRERRGDASARETKDAVVTRGNCHAFFLRKAEGRASRTRRESGFYCACQKWSQSIWSRAMRAGSEGRKSSSAPLLPCMTPNPETTDHLLSLELRKQWTD